MNKEELKVRLQIAEGELRDDIENENGCFDEIARSIFVLALNSGLLQEESTEDVSIQLDKSVRIVHWGEREYLDSVYLETENEVCFTASSLDGSEIYVYDLEDIAREDVIKVIVEIIKMCKED